MRWPKILNSNMGSDQLGAFKVRTWKKRRNKLEHKDNKSLVTMIKQTVRLTKNFNIDAEKVEEIRKLKNL